MNKPIIKSIFILLCMVFSLLAYADSSTKALFRSKDNPVAGNPKGSVTIAEFFDYQCSHCTNMMPTIAAILKTNPNVRFVFKEYPVRSVTSQFATKAALAANKQNKYIVFNHALLMSRLALTENNILNIAKSVGLNIPKLKADMKSQEIVNQVNANYDLAEALGITGTPAFFIGKTSETNINRVDSALGEMSRSEMQAAVNKARA